jgi:tetratricopeptide (TPR) repeat protein
MPTSSNTPAPRGTPRPSLPDLDTLDADGKFRRVELLCQRNAYSDALPIMRVLLEENRKSAKYLGMLSHVLFGRTTDTSFPKELIDCVNHALRIDPDQVHALYTKARCYKRLGKEREALHYFRRTLNADPNHLDAAREARLLVSRLTDRRKR